MGRKGSKIPAEIKLRYAQLCIENKMSKQEAARQLGVNDGVFTHGFTCTEKVEN